MDNPHLFSLWDHHDQKDWSILTSNMTSINCSTIALLYDRDGFGEYEVHCRWKVIQYHPSVGMISLNLYYCFWWHGGSVLSDSISTWMVDCLGNSQFWHGSPRVSSYPWWGPIYLAIFPCLHCSQLWSQPQTTMWGNIWIMNFICEKRF